MAAGPDSSAPGNRGTIRLGISDSDGGGSPRGWEESANRLGRFSCLGGNLSAGCRLDWDGSDFRPLRRRGPHTASLYSQRIKGCRYWGNSRGSQGGLRLLNLYSPFGQSTPIFEAFGRRGLGSCPT